MRFIKADNVLSAPEEVSKQEPQQIDFLISKKNSEEQIVYGVVYAPNHVDTDWETMTAKDVQDMAWNFLASGKVFKIDVQHDLNESGCYVVESFLVRENDPWFGEENLGAWVLGVKCTDDVWKQVLDGDLNGFSFYGTSIKYPAKVLMEVAKQITGMTEESTADIIPPHQHNFIVNLDMSGNIISGKTDSVMEHSHTIRLGTATAKELDHAHRIFME